ncbi:MAG: hypothetical protein ACOCUI_05145 [bacterium]
MPTNSIFKKFIIDSDEKLEILLQEENAPGRKTKKVDIDKKLKEGRKLLEKI